MPLAFCCSNAAASQAGALHPHPPPAPTPPKTRPVAAVDLDKVAAAEDVLRRVAAASPACRAVVREMGELVDGYIELAAVPATAMEAEEMAFPGGLRRSRQ